MSPSCSQLTQLYQTWNDSLTVVTRARLEYQETGSLEDKKVFDHVLSQAKQAQENYREVANALVKLVGYERFSPIVQIEALMVERINDLLRVGIEHTALVQVGIGTKQNRIYFLGFENSSALTPSINRAVALGISYLRGLETLLCPDTQLSMLPDTLPDSLESIDIQNTPAANDPKVQEKLNAFQEVHPEAQVLF